LGSAAATWAAVALADKLDTIVGLFQKAGEKPTGSRDPFGLRRAAHGVLRILADLHQFGVRARPALGPVVDTACDGLGVPRPTDETAAPLQLFLMERLQHLMGARGHGYAEVQVVTGGGIDRVMTHNVADLIEWAGEWRRVVGTPVFESAAEAYKRASRIVEVEWDTFSQGMPRERQQEVLKEPAEIALREALDRVSVDIKTALSSRQPRRAIEAIASIQPVVSRFFDDVRVVVPDETLKTARLSLLRDFKRAVSDFGDPSVLAPRQS
jgi:glycyl-tRNA synthetase beta chain